jgi:hypothetical protein
MDAYVQCIYGFHDTQRLIMFNDTFKQWFESPPNEALPLLFRCSRHVSYSFLHLFKYTPTTPYPAALSGLYPFIESTLIKGAEYWINDVTRIQSFLRSLALMIRTWDICALIPAVHRTVLDGSVGDSVYPSSNTVRLEDVLETIRTVRGQLHEFPYLCSTLYHALEYASNRMPNIFFLMSNGGLPVAHIYHVLFLWIAWNGDPTASALAVWQRRYRWDLTRYISYHQALPRELMELSNMRRFRLPRVGNFWHNSYLLCLVCEYVINCSEQETEAIEECVALLNA